MADMQRSRTCKALGDWYVSGVLHVVAAIVNRCVMSCVSVSHV
jgi:hypothetical protein